jgi:putative heme iron utilization protein
MRIPLASAIHLLHTAPHAVLATHSTQMPGYPYATALPLVVDAAHRPLLLISALAEHTKNLIADARASLAVIEPGGADVQNAARMTLLGTFERHEPSPASLARYLRYQPEAKQYLQLDFMFFRLNIERIRFIGGVGKMGWLEAEDWQAASLVSAETESSLLNEAELLVPTGIRLIGLDPYGLDYELDSVRHRRQFESPMTPEELGKSLPDRLRSLL